jgi:GNAT superfamily N-acetyltransferase|tara:strand:- start:131 stop:574 length:444 start_codon:yes stop_codon:yes gene_type:complete
MDIRPLSQADYKEWRKLWVSYLDFYETSLNDEVIDKTFNRFIDKHQAKQNAFVAEKSSVLVGLVHYIYHPHNWKIEDVCYLQDLFVAPENRGQQIAKMLIEKVYEEADKCETPTVYWLTQEFNAPARKLYDKIADLTPFIKYARRNK